MISVFLYYFKKPIVFILNSYFIKNQFKLCTVVNVIWTQQSGWAKVDLNWAQQKVGIIENKM